MSLFGGIFKLCLTVDVHTDIYSKNFSSSNLSVFLIYHFFTFDFPVSSNILRYFRATQNYIILYHTAVIIKFNFRTNISWSNANGVRVQD